MLVINAKPLSGNAAAAPGPGRRHHLPPVDSDCPCVSERDRQNSNPSMLIEVDVKSPPSAASPVGKSPAQIRLESRSQEKSPKSPAQIQASLENAEANRKALLQARADKSREQFEKAKTVCTKQQEAFSEMTNKIAEDIQTRLATAETIRTAATEKIQEKAAAESAKAKEAQAKKQQTIQSLQDKDGKLREKLSAAEERRQAFVNEQKEKAAAIVTHAKDVAAQQEEKEATKREDLRKEIQAKLDGAGSRRATSLASPAKAARSKTPAASPAPAGAGASLESAAAVPEGVASSP
jgi:colicin import membrane protein